MKVQGTLAVVLTVLVASSSLLAVHAHTQPNKVGACDAIPGYDVVPNSHVPPGSACRTDSTSNAPDAAAASTACDQDPTCQGFAFRVTDHAYRLLTCTRPAVSNEGTGNVCLYQKITKAVCKVVPGFLKAADVAMTPEDGTVLVDGIADNTATLTACANDPACQAATYSTADSYGMTLLMAGTISAAPGYCSYYKAVTACPIVPGFNAQLDQDLEGGNVGAASGNVSVIAAACRANPNCQGFNSAGQLKSATSPLSYKRGICFYSKNPVRPPTGCPVLGGYTVSYNKDHAGDDLAALPAGTPAAAIAAACSTNPACKGFNSRGALKTVVSPLAAADGVCTYVKANTVCKPYPGYDTQIDLLDVNTVGQVSSIAEAFAACEADPSCVSFSSDGSVRNALYGSTFAPGVCQYIKVKPTCPVVAGYAATVDTDVEGATIGSAATIQLAIRACEKNENCKAFNSKGVLKSTASAMSYKRGTCLYVKLPTVCEVIIGFTYIPDTNVLNASISNYKNVLDAANACLDDKNCQGISIAGSGPTKVIQTEPASGVREYCRGSCFYEKGTACADIPGYGVRPGYDTGAAYAISDAYAPGNDGLMDAVNNCTYNADCKGFNYVQAVVEGEATFFTKISSTNNLTLLTKNPGSCFYTKLPTVCREIRRGWVVETDRTIPGGRPFAKSLAQNWFGCALNGINLNESYYPPCYGITTDADMDGYRLVGLENTYTSVYKYGSCHWYKTTWNLDTYTTKLSARKKAYASSTQAPYLPAMAVDGVLNRASNRWQSQPSNVDTDMWLSVDLADVYGITKVRFWNWIERQDMLGADFGARVYYTNQTMMYRNQSEALDEETSIKAGKTALAGVITGDTTLLVTVLEQGFWDTESPGIARWVAIQKRISTASALAGNVTFGTPEVEVYGVALPKLFRDDLPEAQRYIGY